MCSIKKLLDLLSSSEKKRVILLMGMIFLMAFLDMLGVASILPFIALLSNPSLFESNSYLLWAYQFSKAFGVDSAESFMFIVGLLVFFLLIFSLIFKALTFYAQTRFALMCEYSLSKRLVEGYLYQSYSWFLNRHSADLGKNILSEVGNVISGGLIPLITIVSQVTVTTTILILLVLVDPSLAISVGIIFGITYSIILFIVKGLLGRLGQNRNNANQKRYTVISEAFGAIREIKAGGLELSFIQRFAEPAKVYARSQSAAQVIGQLPRYLVEVIAFGGMLIIILYLMAQSGSFTSALPVIALYAFAGYRLMPALQQIYGACVQLSYLEPSLKALHTDLIRLNTVKNECNFVKPMQLNSSIELKNIVYRYPNTKIPAINRINLRISSQSVVGLVGLTGSGKTTTADIILGLLEPQEGVLEIDGQVVNKANLSSWQHSVGYVPQQIYLADDTVAANIAFGVDAKNIDLEAVIRAAKIANLHEFIHGELPQQYQTTIGERGVRLSGGQRQRIGIARALYHNPQVLILDEATSALDNLTEQAVMEAVHNLESQMTIILIAHRLSTVRKCNSIFLFDQGSIKSVGSFEELNESSELFREMASR